MLPIVLIHGYSSEGKNTKAEDIYGTRMIFVTLSATVVSSRSTWQGGYL